MRGKYALVFVAVVLALAGTGLTAFADAGGDANGGNSAAAHDNKGQAQKAEATQSSNHDPSNPDGTYRGKSPSKPDQDGIGADHGIDNNDKTGAGTDGNNGCGNDADREDDNNGWCGNKPANVKPTQAPTETPEVSPTETTQAQAEVLGRTFTRPEVLGRGLARTGVAPMMFVLAALALAVLGFALRAIARPQHR